MPATKFYTQEQKEGQLLFLLQGVQIEEDLSVFGVLQDVCGDQLQRELLPNTM